MTTKEEALAIAKACGNPIRASLFDEEAVEGWIWTHPDGREWFAVSAWNMPPPTHPVFTMNHINRNDKN